MRLEVGLKGYCVDEIYFRTFVEYIELKIVTFFYLNVL